MASAQKIMIIEDDSTLLGALRENFADEGYEVLDCLCAREAFDLLEEVKPDLVITDLIMHDVDGFGVLQHLHDSVHLSKIPAIVLSNNSSEDDVAKAKSLGAVDYLIKAELSLGDIIDRVSTLLDKPKKAK
jgi:PleD family two-component response regulator